MKPIKGSAALLIAPLMIPAAALQGEHSSRQRRQSHTHTHSLAKLTHTQVALYAASAYRTVACPPPPAEPCSTLRHCGDYRKQMNFQIYEVHRVLLHLQGDFIRKTVLFFLTLYMFFVGGC